MTIRTTPATLSAGLAARKARSGTPSEPGDRFERSPGLRRGLGELGRKLSGLREGAIVGGSTGMIVGGWIAGAVAALGLISAGHPLVGVGLALGMGVAGTVGGSWLMNQ